MRARPKGLAGWAASISSIAVRLLSEDSGQNGAFDDPNKGCRWAEEDHSSAGSGYRTEFAAMQYQITVATIAVTSINGAARRRYS